MQSTINSYFSPKTTPEKSKSASATPEKSTTSSPKPTTPSPSTKKSTNKKTPEKEASPEKDTEVKSKSPTTKTPKVSPSADKPSRKRKTTEDGDSNEVEAPPSPKSDEKSKKTFSSDALLDDDATLASVDLEATATPAKKSKVDEAEKTAPTTPSKPVATVEPPKFSFFDTYSKLDPNTTTTTTTKPTAPSTPTKFGSLGKPALSEKQSELSARLVSHLTDESWKEVLQPEFKKAYFTNLVKFLESQYAIKNNNIFPPEKLIFNALNHASFDKVKVVILGQDPYIQKNQAMGMSFSVPRGVTPPGSLRNIYKELESDIQGFKKPAHGDLTKWADQGVLMLNAVLTVQEGLSNSHKGKGWESFTSAVINAINTKKSGVVFLLWGRDAQNNAAGVDSKKHLVLKAAHPSPMAQNAFAGNKHFSKTNKWLEDKGLTPIDWTL